MSLTYANTEHFARHVAIIILFDSLPFFLHAAYISLIKSALAFLLLCIPFMFLLAWLTQAYLQISHILK